MVPNKLLEKEVKSCLPGQATTPVTTRTPLVMSELPSKPWEYVAIDCCGPFPTVELVFVVVDEYSGYPELEIVTSTSMSAIEIREWGFWHTFNHFSTIFNPCQSNRYEFSKSTYFYSITITILMIHK